MLYLIQEACVDPASQIQGVVYLDTFKRKIGYRHSLGMSDVGRGGVAQTQDRVNDTSLRENMTTDDVIVLGSCSTNKCKHL